MKTLRIGEYILTIEKRGARYYYRVSLGKLPIVTKHEGSAHRAVLRGLSKIETLINL